MAFVFLKGWLLAQPPARHTQVVLHKNHHSLLLVVKLLKKLWMDQKPIKTIDLTDIWVGWSSIGPICIHLLWSIPICVVKSWIIHQCWRMVRPTIGTQWDLNKYIYIYYSIIYLYLIILYIFLMLHINMHIIILCIFWYYIYNIIILSIFSYYIYYITFEYYIYVYHIIKHF